MLRTIFRIAGIYWIYEKWLSHTVLSKPLPTHVALILDGNRRWARNRGWPPWTGHAAGADKVEEVLEWLLDLGIKTVTLYVLSTENLRRPEEEVNEIFRLIKEKADSLRRDPKIYKSRVKVKVIGRKELLPRDVAEALEKLEEATSLHDKHFLNLAVAYGGRREILDAVKQVAAEVKQGNISVEEIDEKTFAKYLYTNGVPNPEPDLIIRTSGESRISNFLLWQSAYSEFVFQDVNLPDFRYIDLLRAFRVYQNRERRFGL
ncbi:MAG: polyprenyl diphosphate synthase [Candidatus Caldarchaeum sp.]|nr:polyprenyl diphosphate synthase [Candidatus Caldarchaeum sp.]MCX8200916.1 polyprenyl diphosphate synthase [Candidatus Caldarchaeum sp.]MDW8062934.1 polyprenyl diphosphate synthase [Candidatus Caldarchaeum sp.]